jgi:hypothetical protein
MIPSGYKEDVVYSQIPTDGSGDLSFTRASNGTRINSSGLVEVCPWNLLEQSNAFSTSPWSLTRATLTSGQSGYDGLTNAWKYTEGTFTANLPVLEQSFTSSSDVETYSFYLKAGTRNWVAISVQGTGYIWINLTDGTVGSAGGGTPPTATTQLVGNGWYLVSVSSTGTKFGINLHITDANNSTSYNGNGTGFVYVQNAQRNIGSTAKPYFPTTDRLNVPRLTYQNGGGGCPSLLLEKQSTNLVTYSEQFDNAGWLKFNGAGGSAPVVTPNYALSPDGTMNADRVQLARTTQTFSYSEIKQVFGTTGTQYTVSVYLKSLSGNPTISMANDGATFNFLATLTSEWVRYTATFTASGTPSAELILYEQVTSSSLTADFLVWGFQAEASSYPTSYIPTTSSSATRVADACFKTGISSLIGQTEGTLFFELQRNDTDNDTRLQISDGSGINWLFVSIETGLNPRAYCNVGGVNQFSVYGSAVSNSTHKVALAYKSNDFKVYIDGVAVITQTSGSVPACNRIDVGSGSPNGPVVSTSLIKEVVLFPTRLTNAELAQLTA